MSKFAVKGAATGTGTFTLESPATNTDRTFTLPDTDGSFITADGSGNVTISGGLTLTSGTANGVTYLNGSKVLTSGSALTFDASNFKLTGADNNNLIWSVNSNAGAQSIRIQANVAGLYLQGAGTVDPLYITQSSATGYIVFRPASDTEGMRLNSTGLGIGTSSPAEKLEVAGNIKLNTTSPDLYFTVSTGTKYNWMVAAQENIDNCFEITPSTTAGGSTFSTPAVVINSSGNLGLGVTPSAWSAPYKVIEGGDSNSSGTIGFRTDNVGGVETFANAYYDGGSKYKFTGSATQFQQNSSQFRWYIAPSGTAGNAISFTQAMTLHASGGLSLGNTTDPGAKTLNVDGVSVGRGAGAVATNTAVGASALAANTSGFNSTAFGYQALATQTTTNSNTAFGYLSMTATTSGYANSALGSDSLKANNTGIFNTAIGQASLGGNTSGGSNVAVGASALQANLTASSNTAVGYQAGYSITTNGVSVFVGNQAGYAATGFGNTCIGHLAGNHITTLTTGGGNILLGPYSKPAAGSNDYSVIIGWNSVGKGSSTGIIGGGDGGTSAMYQGNNSSTWSTTSDQRLKKNIVDNNDGLEKINAIQVRNFEYRLPEEVDAELAPTDAVKKAGVQLGVIAQELHAVLPDCVKTESTGVMSVNSDNLIWYAINAIKELKAENDSLKARLDAANL
jgi:hypothetical protein